MGMCWNLSTNSSGGGYSLPWLTVVAPGQKSARDVAVLELSWQRSKGSQITIVLKTVRLYVCGLVWQFPRVTPPLVAMKRKPNLEYNDGAFASDYMNTGMHGHSNSIWLVIKWPTNGYNVCIT